jgi:peptide/nickel transport system permease protein
MPSEGVANSQVLSRATIVATGSSRYWRRVLARLSRDKVTLAALVVLVAIVLMALLAPWLTNGDPYSGSALQRLKPIGTSGHPLGTDEIGRDLWARLAYGGRLSMLAGILPVAFALAIGGSLGVLAGYVGGWLNTLIMRTMDVFYAFPSVLLAVAIAAVAGSGLINTVLALGIVFIPPMVRIAESVSTRVRNMDFIDAARASGASTLKIIQHHVLRNVLGPVLVYAASLTSLSIVLAAGLSFLGLGVPPPQPEWGQMLNALRQSIYVQPWLAALPGIMIFVTSLCFNLISDGFRSAMDVHES